MIKLLPAIVLSFTFCAPATRRDKNMVLYTTLGVVTILLLSICAPLSVNASIGSDEFCSDNPDHFACDGKVGNSEDDGEDDPDYATESDLSDEEKDEKKDNPIGTCYGAGYEDGQNGPFNESVYKDNCYGEYYEGFIDGCIDAGNTRDVCESATDA